jgi:hypothetical protein
VHLQVRRLRLVGEYVTAAGLGAIDLLKDMATGTYTLIVHPLDTASAITEFITSPDALDKLQQAATQHLLSVADVSAATATPQAFRTWTKDALDVVSVLAPLTKVGKAGSVGKAARSATATRKATPLVFETVPPGTTDIQKLGNVAERNARSWMKTQGWDVHVVQKANGAGLDGLGSRLNPQTGLTEFVFMESKATFDTLEHASQIRLGNTKHGVQMGTDWLTKKCADLHKTHPRLVQEMLDTLETSKGAAPPSRLLVRATADHPLLLQNERLPHFDSGEFHRNLKDIVERVEK